MKRQITAAMLVAVATTVSLAQTKVTAPVGSAILGAIIRGGWGEVVSQGGQIGFGAAFLRYSRDYEKQADILGAQIMARAGYDPRDMASMFRTIEKEGGNRGPEWLSNHPNPGNRAEYITREAQALRVSNPVRDTEEFRSVQSRLSQMSPAPTSEEAARSRGNTNPRSRTGTGARPTGRVEAPSTRYTNYSPGNLFRVSVPSNWREMSSENSVTYAPEGASGDGVFTHGVQVGIMRNEQHNLEEATNELMASLAQSNPQLARSGNPTRGTLGGRQALRVQLANVSDVTGRERLMLYTAQMQDGTLFYLIGVAPEGEFGSYQSVIERIAGSVRFQR